MNTIKSFIGDWNRLHGDFMFSATYVPVSDRPDTITVRFDADKYQHKKSEWYLVANSISERSKETMFLASNEYMLEKGIIRIEIACASKRYREQNIIETLRWLTKDANAATR